MYVYDFYSLIFFTVIFLLKRRTDMGASFFAETKGGMVYEYFSKYK